MLDGLASDRRHFFWVAFYDDVLTPIMLGGRRRGRLRSRQVPRRHLSIFSIFLRISLAPRSPLLLDGPASGPRHLFWVSSYHDVLARCVLGGSAPRAPSEAGGALASLVDFL